MPQLKNVDAFAVNQAEMFDNENGIETEQASEDTLNLMMGGGDWVKISGIDFGSGATGMTARVAANGSGQGSFSPLSVQSDSAASNGQYIEWSNNGSNQMLSSASDSASGQIQIPFG